MMINSVINCINYMQRLKMSSHSFWPSYESQASPYSLRYLYAFAFKNDLFAKYLIKTIQTIQYVAVGMAAGPIGQIRGYLDPREKLERVRNRRLGIEIEITEIQRNQHEGQNSAAVFNVSDQKVIRLEFNPSKAQKNNPKS